MRGDFEAQTGQKLRLRGQGLNKRRGGRGDEFVTLKIIVPKEAGEEERRLYEDLKRVSRFNPRAKKPDMFAESLHTDSSLREFLCG